MQSPILNHQSSLLYLDCFSGVSGDMLLGALIDAGVPLADVRRALGSLAIDADAVWTERVVRTGVTATKFQVRGEGDGHSHDHGRDAHDHGAHDHGAHEHVHEPGHTHAHAHAHGHGHDQGHDHAGHTAHVDPPPGRVHAHHVHRTLAEIAALIDGSLLSAAGKDRAKALFARMGDAEAAIHGTTRDRVHLHEVGALDSIVDIVGAVFALEAIGADEIVCSPLNVGSGTVKTAHGLYPVPAPATMALLDGVPIYAGPQQAELVTPTGALLVSSYATSYGPVPAMRPRRVGYGAGTRDFPETPNVLRVLLGEGTARAAAHAVTVIECEIDDMTPQIFGALMDRLLAEGALDVFYTAVQMKKNRPGTLLTVVSPPSKREALTALVFRETTTIGVRYREMARECLDREEQRVATPYGEVRMKIARRNGELLNASPEFDDVLAIARREGRPVKDVQAAAMKAFLDGGRP